MLRLAQENPRWGYLRIAGECRTLGARVSATSADDATGAANNVGHQSGDLCWKSDNATLALNGRASELVKDATGAWRLKNDDGSKVERLTNAWNADNDTEAWRADHL